MELEARLAAGGQRRQRVQHVVPAGHVQLHRRALGKEARAQLHQLDLAAGEAPESMPNVIVGGTAGSSSPTGATSTGTRPAKSANARSTSASEP